MKQNIPKYIFIIYNNTISNWYTKNIGKTKHSNLNFNYKLFISKAICTFIIKTIKGMYPTFKTGVYKLFCIHRDYFIVGISLRLFLYSLPAALMLTITIIRRFYMSYRTIFFFTIVWCTTTKTLLLIRIALVIVMLLPLLLLLLLTAYHSNNLYNP